MKPLFGTFAFSSILNDCINCFILASTLILFLNSKNYIILNGFQTRVKMLANFALASGQSVLLVGPPGSGKTTVANDLLNVRGLYLSLSCCLCL